MKRQQLTMRATLALTVALLPAAAHANCPAANLYSFEFGAAAPATLNYAASYSYTGVSPALGNQNFTISWPLVNGTTTTVVAGLQMPRIDPIINDGNPATANNLIVGMVLAGRTADITGGTRVIVTRFTFPTAIRAFSIQLNDIDFNANQFRDWLHISGSNGASVYSPAITTPSGNNNGSGPRTAAPSTINLGPGTTPFVMTDREAIGNANALNTDDTGTLTAVFTEPVTQVEIRYGNNGVSPGGTATTQQAYGIQRVSWCPMPVLAIAKSSAPAVTNVSDPNRFAIPDADIDYVLTVTNTGGSPVDVNSTILRDVLPANVSFFSGDIDTATAGVQNFVFNPGTSGLSFSQANLAYSNNGGASFGYTPAAGYDAAVNALQLSPQGAMAANSSFTIRFRTRIK
jgi:uncharacterized repeat protein (TIGR01451 family)